MLDKILNSKETNYSSSLNEQRIKEKISRLFTHGKLSMAGRFTSENEFAAHDKWTIINWHMPKFKRSAAYLKGQITSSEEGSEIKVNFQPNSLLPTFAIVSAVLGLIAIIAGLFNIEHPFTLLIGLFFLAVGLFCYFVGQFSTNRLRNRFEKHLDMRKVI